MNIKKNVMRVLTHQAALPVLTAGYGVVAGYVLGKRNGDTFEVVVGDGEIFQAPGDDPHHLHVKFPEMTGEVLSFDPPPAKPSDPELTDEQVAVLTATIPDPAEREKVLERLQAPGGAQRLLGRITEVHEDEGGMTADMELSEEGAAVVHEGTAAADEELARASMSVYGADADAVESVFDSPVGEWDYDAQMAGRGDKNPYVIHMDEYHSEESGFRQSALTYYMGDDVMTDEDDRPVFNFEEIVGPLMWGIGSNNSDMFYARNPRLESEYEVGRSYESYAQVILGVEADAAVSNEEIKHSKQLTRMSRED